MKKLYSKPTVELVDFSLSSSVANGCNNDNGYEDIPLMVEGDITCCYHNPTDEGGFGS